jgi:DNA mismatch endonuclease (patch repair protein)
MAGTLKGESKSQSRTKEDQDTAAGGEKYRRVRLPDGREAHASVSVQTFPRSYQKWGYLRFKVDGKTRRVYIGKVTADTREESLSIAWSKARENGSLEKTGWEWVYIHPRFRAFAQK